jgi:hypothetical protein
MPVLGQGGAVIQFVNTSGRPAVKKSSFEIEKGKYGVPSTMREKNFVLFIKYDYGDKYNDDS